MATYVEVGDLGILIDPGATLAPTRWGLPPAEAEWQALRRANDRISAYATRARLIFVSHYHEDHFRSDPVTYAGHTVLAKDPRRMIAGAPRRRRHAARPRGGTGRVRSRAARALRVRLRRAGTALGGGGGVGDPAAADAALSLRPAVLHRARPAGGRPPRAAGDAARGAASRAVERRAQAAGARAAAGRDGRCYHDSRETYFRQKGERPVTDQKTLNVGDQAPAFTLKTIGMKDVSLGDYKGKNVVLLFYPLDWTPG